MASYDASDDRGLSAALLATLLRIAALLWLLHAAVFIAFDALPDAAYSTLGVTALKKELLEQTRERMGLVGSLPQRYLHSLWNCCRLDFGLSLRTGFPVSELLFRRALNSLPVIGASVALSLAGLLAGSWFYATKNPGWIHRLFLLTAPVCFLPQFATASAFAALAILSRSWQPIDFDMVSFFLLTTSIAFMPTGILFTASSRTALSVAQQPFVTTYCAMGMSWGRTRILLQTNVLRLMLPLINRALLALLLGTVFAELSFDRPGIGAVFTEAIRSGDQPIAAGWLIVVGAPAILFTQLISAWSARLPSGS